MTYSFFFRRAVWLPTIAVGCVLTLSSCGSGGSGSGNSKTIFFDEANRELFVQPIQVCDDFGRHCARMNLFAEMTAKILEQARLKVNFLPANKLNNSRFLTIGDEKNNTNELYELSRQGQPEDYGRHEDSTRTGGPINVWFVEEILSSNGNIQFGSAWVDANGVILSEETIDFNGGKGRPDTLAHELGHNLGLKHTTFGAGGADNLLTDGNNRNVPNDIGDVYPNGAGTSRLTAEQIDEILNSGFLSETTAADGSVALADTTPHDIPHSHSHDIPHSHSHDISHSHSHDASHSHSHDTSHSHSHDIPHSHSHDIPHNINSDLSTLSLDSLQLQSATTSAANQVPEPSSWVALGLIGLSSMLVSRRRRAQRQTVKKATVNQATVNQATVSQATVNSCLTPYIF